MLNGKQQESPATKGRVMKDKRATLIRNQIESLSIKKFVDKEMTRSGSFPRLFLSQLTHPVPHNDGSICKLSIAQQNCQNY